VISRLQETVTRQAMTRPDAVAVVMGEERLAYGELDQLSNQFAQLLIEHGCSAGDRVCMLADKGLGAIVGMIATLKAGCAYVPVDVSSPAARVRMVLDSADPGLILVSSGAAALADELILSGAVARRIPIGSVENQAVRGEAFATAFSVADCATQAGDAAPPGAGGSGADLAHILFTSGSTGAPKGVMITHRNVIEFITWATAYFETSAEDRNSGHPPLHFDLSTFDIYATFLAGAELHLVPPEASLFPQKLAQLIRDSALTQWFAVPSILTYMAKFDVFEPGDFPSLARVIWCGEVLPTTTLMHWMDRLPHATFTNLYGPTETTIASSYYTIPGVPTDATAPIPIGIACDGEELLVLDAELRPVAVDDSGDLYIGGTGLSPGYWRDGAKTREAFVADPRDPNESIYRTGDLARVDAHGLAYFLGRSDSQIKHRGYRIELLEVEVAISALQEIRECAVVAVESAGFEGTTIGCAYVAGDPSAVPLALRTRLRDRLPPYMLPTRWLELESLPKNANGKIDRRLLQERFSTAGGGTRNAIEISGRDPDRAVR
jgi:amino acid adenylation domain-containing protein